MSWLNTWARKANQSTVVLHGIYAERSRQTKSGSVKRRVTIQTDATPVLHMFDEVALGAEPAQAIAEVYRDAIKGIKAFISGATLDRRERHRKNPSTRSYSRRYKGGRTGETPPKPNAVRWGNDSGRLAEGITTRHVPSQKAFITNVPANRLNRELFGRGFDAFLAELARRAPILANAHKLAGVSKVKQAIEHSRDILLVKAEKANAAKIRQLRQARLNLARQALSLVA